MIWAWLLLAACLVLAALLLMRLAFAPPRIAGRSRSRALPASEATTLGRAAARLAAGGCRPSGVTSLIGGGEAFLARIGLIRAAEESLDVQYYIWQRDATGLMLLGELQAAAERGVRIRLLLDDNGAAALDRDLAALNAHPSVEVRLFNPFILRRPRSAGFLFDFTRLNRRMHNKSLTADGAATVLGGRNVGDIYFGYGEGVHYVDHDILGLGEIARDVGRDFDRYWASASAQPVERILRRPRPGGWQALAGAAAAAAAHEASLAYSAALAGRDPVAALMEDRLELDCVAVTLLSDDPAKGVGRAPRRRFLYPQLVALAGTPATSLDLVSAYFVPGRGFTRALTTLARRGRRVRVLTNSQQATDVLVVHSAYVKYRPRLIAAGVELYELKPQGGARMVERRIGRRAVMGSQRSSLHSKTLAIDGKRLFIGSFNFDHRSLDLNTEMGVLIESERLAARLNRAFEAAIPEASYRPLDDPRTGLVWTEADGTRHLAEPQTNIFSRTFLVLLGRLPVEWLL